MRTADDQPVGPEIGAALAAIDATLAGEPVDPSHAELAELALILAAERPQPTPAFTSALDRRVAARFAGEWLRAGGLVGVECDCERDTRGGIDRRRVGGIYCRPGGRTGREAGA